MGPCRRDVMRVKIWEYWTCGRLVGNRKLEKWNTSASVIIRPEKIHSAHTHELNVSHQPTTPDATAFATATIQQIRYDGSS